MEETIGYEALFSSDEWDSLNFGSWEPEPPRKTSLTENDALRMARGLEDYELVDVIDHGGSAELGYWLTIHDRRFDLRYAIESHCDYWDFISYFAAGQQWPVPPLPTNQSSSGVADDGSGGAVVPTDAAPEESPRHNVTVRFVDDGYELSCDRSDFSDHVCDVRDADNLIRLHEAFVARLVARLDADR